MGLSEHGAKPPRKLNYNRLYQSPLWGQSPAEEIDARSNWDETPLIMAARSQKSLPTCDFLVSEGADMQAPKATEGCRRIPKDTEAKLLFKDTNFNGKNGKTNGDLR